MFSQVLLSIRTSRWEERLGVLVRNLRTVRVVYRVNVSESSGAGSPGLSQIKDSESGI